MKDYKPLSLKESLNLADKVNDWNYSKSMIENKKKVVHEGIPSDSKFITSTYSGELDGLRVVVSQLYLKEKHYVLTGNGVDEPYKKSFFTMERKYVIEIKHENTILNTPKKLEVYSLRKFYDKLESKRKTKIIPAGFNEGIIKSRSILSKKVK
jgi:hypothetical protein